MVAGFRMPGYVSSAMAMPLFKSLHYSNTDIATVTKLFGFGVALAGTFLASFVVPRIGILASLVVGTVFGSASHLALAYLAIHGGAVNGGDGGGAFWTFAAAVSIDSFAYAFASIVLITYMSTLASTEHAASQYALLTSLCALPGSLLAGASGFIIDDVGFAWFFVAHRADRRAGGDPVRSTSGTSIRGPTRRPLEAPTRGVERGRSCAVVRTRNISRPGCAARANMDARSAISARLRHEDPMTLRTAGLLLTLLVVPAAAQAQVYRDRAPAGALGAPVPITVGGRAPWQPAWAYDSGGDNDRRPELPYYQQGRGQQTGGPHPQPAARRRPAPRADPALIR